MLMPITYSEKKLFTQNSDHIALELLNLSNFDNSVLLFKVLAHAMKNNDDLIRAFDESIFEDPDTFKEKFSILLEHALIQACKQEVEPTQAARQEYSPKELSTFLGVSVVTIHNWIKQGRFEGVELVGANKHNRISDDTMYITPANKKISIRDIVQMWEKQERELSPVHYEDNQSYYTRQIALYEEKYQGEFEHTLGAQRLLTPEEESDAQVWRHYLRRQQLEFRNTEE
ncbi:helix-turn-helix domain-containing protein [Paenibacillus sp. 481]|uniref:helix-turn-helix domain-containing protein n=1 Tax=Paenibacillus sp. 481 TaxID=2835869 RepID=UPI001E3F075C|nr:helix-turn-helix domain-containing protein [Paenibacillus sp. 481]UHA75470.1 helix-turn-helix domain-containing protein [Paenibacillus sp. 481]